MKLRCAWLLAACVFLAQVLANDVSDEKTENVPKRMRWYRRGFEVARARNRSVACACCNVGEGDAFACMCVTWPLWYPLTTTFNFVDGCFRSDEYVNKAVKKAEQRAANRR